jgi:hypothetical protein
LRFIVAGWAMIALAACVTTSKIVPAGQDTYKIGAANDGCGNCAPPRIRLIEQAGDYCSRMGKTMIAKDLQAQPFDIGFGHRVTLTFSCALTPADKTKWLDKRSVSGSRPPVEP